MCHSQLHDYHKESRDVEISVLCFLQHARGGLFEKFLSLMDLKVSCKESWTEFTPTGLYGAALREKKPSQKLKDGDRFVWKLPVKIAFLFVSLWELSLQGCCILMKQRSACANSCLEGL